MMDKQGMNSFKIGDKVQATEALRINGIDVSVSNIGVITDLDVENFNHAVVNFTFIGTVSYPKRYLRYAPQQATTPAAPAAGGDGIEWGFNFPTNIEAELDDIDRRLDGSVYTTYIRKHIEKQQAELTALRAERDALREALQPLRDAATHAYNCLDAVYETFDGDLGIDLSRAIPKTCAELKAALEHTTSENGGANRD